MNRLQWMVVLAALSWFAIFLLWSALSNVGAACETQTTMSTEACVLELTR